MGGMEVQLHAFLTSALDGGERSVSGPRERCTGVEKRKVSRQFSNVLRNICEKGCLSNTLKSVENHISQVDHFADVNGHCKYFKTKRGQIKRETGLWEGLNSSRLKAMPLLIVGKEE
jgi:hypothetical protein